MFPPPHCSPIQVLREKARSFREDIVVMAATRLLRLTVRSAEPTVCRLEEIELSMLQVRRLPLLDLCSHCHSKVLAVDPKVKAWELRVRSSDSFFCIE